MLVDRRYVPEAVLAAAERALLDAFSFPMRAFAQAVTAAEVITVVQRVAGVLAVDLEKLYLTTEPPGVRQALPAEGARRVKDTFQPAQLLLLHAGGIALTEMKP